MDTVALTRNPDAACRFDGKRIGHLDTLRGVAVLGIFAMNSVSLGLGTSAYFNISLPVDSTALDTALSTLPAVLVVVGQSPVFGSGPLSLCQADPGNTSVPDPSRTNCFWIGIGGSVTRSEYPAQPATTGFPFLYLDYAPLYLRSNRVGLTLAGTEITTSISVLRRLY